MRNTAFCITQAGCTDGREIMALTALTALESSDAPVHELVHGRSAHVHQSRYCA